LKLGLFGGAFDPPHCAHVQLAQAAVAQVPLDELLVCPTGQAYHKARDLTPAAHRVEMTKIAFSSVPHTLVDEREIRRAGPTYTVDTLRELRAEQQSAELFLLMGEDQAASFTSWREWQAIAQLATLCIARRQYSAQAQPPLVLPPSVRHVVLTLPILAESATEVRRRTTAGEDIAALVPPGVAGYIARHHLYTPA
jgi:nicotinate-nucleotide adenylyltransferase